MLKAVREKLFTEVNKNTFILLYGTVLSQALPIVFSPILARIYSPAEFGAFALFFGIVAIAGNVSAGKMDLAMYTARSKKNAMITAWSGMTFTLITSSLVVVFSFLFFWFTGTEKLSVASIACIPFTVFALGCSNVLVAVSNREKRFKTISRSKIFLGAIWVLINILLGFLHVGSIGLILGYCLGQIISCWYLYRINSGDLALVKFNRRVFKFNVLRNRNYAFIFLPAHLLNTASASGPSFFLSYLFGLSSNGFFFKSARVGESPTSVIRSSLGNVFWQKASEDYIHFGNARPAMIHFFKKLLFVGAPSYIVLYLIADQLFVFLFGEPWAQAAVYFKILAPYYLIQFTITPLTIMVVLANKPWVDITWQIAYALCIVLSFGYGWLENDVLVGLRTYTISMSAIQIICFVINYYYSVKRD